MLDTLLSDSFDLDFDVYAHINDKVKSYATKVHSPTLKTNNILMEYEQYVKFTDECFNDMISILKRCDEQRKNFRIFTMKYSKDRMIIDKFFKEENSTLILNKFKIQEELRSIAIDHYLLQLQQKDSLIQKLKSQIEMSAISREKEAASHRKASSINNSKSTKTNASDNTSFNGSFGGFNHRNQNSRGINETPQKVEDSNTKDKQKAHGVKAYQDIDIIDSTIWKKMSMDLNNDQYDIISGSPIKTPKSRGPLPVPESIKLSSGKAVQNQKTPKFYMTASGWDSNRAGSSGMLGDGLFDRDKRNNWMKRQLKDNRLSKSIEYDSNIDYMRYKTQENGEILDIQEQIDEKPRNDYLISENENITAHSNTNTNTNANATLPILKICQKKNCLTLPQSTNCMATSTTRTTDKSTAVNRCPNRKCNTSNTSSKKVTTMNNNNNNISNIQCMENARSLRSSKDFSSTCIPGDCSFPKSKLTVIRRKDKS